GRWAAPAAGEGVLSGGAFRAAAPGMYAVASGTVFFPAADRPYLVEPERARLLRVDLPEAIFLKDVGVAPGRDASGRWLLAGRWRPIPGGGSGFENHESGLVRATFPAGRILDLIACEPVPIGPPCWCRDDPDRILYPTAGGTLYSYRFAGKTV